MKINRNDFNVWLGMQTRAFGGLIVWEVSGISVLTITEWFEYLAFLLMTEAFYQFVKWMIFTKMAE